ncbi:MAG: hypothetical protein IKR82_00035 [Bacteroidales bacterium]|nr:hypothetical protein [Bacteroidales bacterium]
MKRILTLAVMLVASIAAFAAEPLSEIDLLVGQELRLMPAGPLLNGIFVEEGEEFLELRQAGYMLVMKGLRAGDTKIRLDLRAGQTSTLLVHVKKLRVRPIIKPGEPEEEQPKAPEWTGTYELRLPENHYSIIYHCFNSDGSERIRETYSRIDDVYVDSMCFESEDGYNGVEDIIRMFEYSRRLGYTGGLHPSGHYVMHYADGDKIAPENEESAHVWFDTYAPQPLAEALYDIEPAGFGRDNHGDDNLMNGTIMQRIRMTGGDQSQLKRFYRGEDVVCGRNCWVFDFSGKSFFGYGGFCVWVDTETGLVLRHEAEEGGGFLVTRFDLNYTDWDIQIRPELFE